MDSIIAPLAYIGVLISSLSLFSYVYRKRQALKQYQPWFDEPHDARNMYITLLQEQTLPDEKKPIPSSDLDTILKAALLQRAVEDVRRIWCLREDKVALSQLLQRGSVGDDVWNRFLSAEKDMEAEVQEVVEEANTYSDGWGQFIFATASELAMNYKNREIFQELTVTRTKLIEEVVKRDQDEKDKEEKIKIEDARREKENLEKKEKDRIKAEKELLAEEEMEKQKTHQTSSSVKKRTHKKK